MIRGDLPGVRILGRPFKPMAVGLIITGFALSVNTFLLYFDGRAYIPLPSPDGCSWLQVAGADLASFVMGLFTGLGLLLMVFAWVVRSQRIYEFGLLFSFGGWTARWMGLALEGSHWYSALPFGVSIMAAGAYWLERSDDKDGMQ